jgi:sugar phosphate isomerase/epimerase
MRIGICASPQSIKPGLEGLAYVEPTTGALLCPREDDASFQKTLAAARQCPLPLEAVNCLIPGDLKCTGPGVDLTGLDAYFTTVCKRAQKAGLRILVFGSGGSRQVPDGFMHAAASEQIVGHLKRWGPIAVRHHLTVALEPLNKGECNIVNSVDEAADLVRRAGHPGIRLVVDTYHMVKDGEGPDAIRRAKGLVAHAHCAEGRNRLAVGLGGEDQRAYFRALKDIGYDGRISIEAQWSNFEEQLPVAVADLRRQIETA